MLFLLSEFLLVLLAYFSDLEMRTCFGMFLHQEMSPDIYQGESLRRRQGLKCLWRPDLRPLRVLDVISCSNSYIPSNS